MAGASNSNDGGGAADATSAAAVETPGAAALWQRITERYDAAQRDAAATMTETNTGARFALSAWA